MNICIEIRPGEGGEDARLLCEIQAKIYIKYAERHKLKVNADFDDG